MKQVTRQFILWYGLFETFVFTGNIFGWTALHYMLRQEGIYEDACEPRNDTAHYANVTDVPSYNLKGYRTCESQDSILNLAYTIGSFCMGSTSFVWGFLLDKWGLRNVRLIINGLITSGCILLSLTVKETSFLLFPSLILMCVAGVPLRLANMQIADLFPERRSTVITLYSGAFSASASVFVFIKYGFDAGLPWEWACFLLVVLSALMLPVTLFVLPADRFGDEKGGLFTGKEKEVSSVAPCVWGTYTYIGDEPPYHRTTTMEKKETKGKSIQAAVSDALFSEIYGIFQISGVFLAPIGGIFMDWSIRRVSKSEKLDPSDHMIQVLRSCFWPMFLTTLLEVVAQVCKFFNLRSAIYVSIVSVTLLRAFFISIGTAYLRIRFPAEHFNRLLGIMSTCSAIFCLFQFPLFIWESSSRQNVLYVNIFDSVCLVIAMIHPLLLVATPLQRYFLKEKSSS
ncbi:unnamed protein product [Larinioides sclopetarius]|uniref:Uncharacterized protein n=1 Tax=Larinioides sclopetarius TaxID=280406 RepID=A0AAV2BVU8_9ARAC